jgi:hypothetical protein
MPKIGTLDFTGISGHKYTFNVYPLNREHKKKKQCMWSHTAPSKLTHQLIMN